MPTVIDHVAVARLYGEPLFAMPQDLYIPPDALQIFLEAFEGPLDLLLYLIRKQNFNILDIPMAGLTRQYLSYVEEIRKTNLELAAEYLLMAAMLIEIKSRMLLPPKKVAEGVEAEDPRAELVRRLLEYEQLKLAAANLNQFPCSGVYRTIASTPIPPRRGGGIAASVGRYFAPCQTGATPQNQPPRTVGTRTHEHRLEKTPRPAFC